MLEFAYEVCGFGVYFVIPVICGYGGVAWVRWLLWGWCNTEILVFLVALLGWYVTLGVAIWPAKGLAFWSFHFQFSGMG